MWCRAPARSQEQNCLRGADKRLRHTPSQSDDVAFQGASAQPKSCGDLRRLSTRIAPDVMAQALIRPIVFADN
jgi:hypothetical protein